MEAYESDLTIPAQLFDGFSRHRIDVGGDITINAVSAGAGPPVLLLHGYPQNLAMWADVAPMLVQAGHTVVCTDLRGYGDSSKPQCLPDHSNYAFRAMAEDNATVMRHLGFPRFHVIGHDRGARTGHRVALDRPDAVLSLAVLDIVPTYAMFLKVNRHIASAYWHWYFLSQPAPFPERMIGHDPDLFFEACLVGWGAMRVQDFNPLMLAEYRRCWHDPAMIHGSCSDYRAAATIDLLQDEADLHRKLTCRTLVLYAASGAMARFFDIPAEWLERCATMQAASLPGGHFFIDQFPRETADLLADFLAES